MNMSYDYNGYKIEIKQKKDKYNMYIAHPHSEIVEIYCNLASKRDCISIAFTNIKGKRYD